MRTRLAMLAVLPLLAVTACSGADEDGGSGDDGSAQTDALEGVDISGEFGSPPEITASGVSVDSQTSVVVSRGDGPEADSEKQTLLHLSLNDGADGKKLASTWDADQPITVGPQAGLIQELVDSLDAATDGVPRGSRVAFATPAVDAVGQGGLSQFQLEEGDSVIVVADILSVQPDSPVEGPEGETVEPPAGAPTVVEEGGNVTGFDWAGVGAKPQELQVHTLIKGDGPVIAEQRLATFDYFGEVFKGKEPFDESYSGEPITFAVGANSLIDAWDEGLVGIPEGSRVMIIAPPDKAYGEQGQPPDIPANATLVFVLDVLDVDA